MSRDEEIKKAEIKYSDDTLFDGCDYVGQYAKQEAFIAGAKWADEHPKPEMVSLDKACKVFQEILIGLCPELLGYGAMAVEWENEFIKKLEK